MARLLVNSPKYVLLDEPFAGVDPISINEIKSQSRPSKGQHRRANN